jgi:hypothetical protein
MIYYHYIALAKLKKMKKICLLVVFITAAISCFSQNPKVLWGSEFKASKEGTDLSVVSVDNSGVYMQESHVAGKGFFGYGVAGTLVKLDKNLSEQYRNDFNRELKGREFEQFFAFQNKLFIVSSDYSRKEKQLSLFIAEIDKNSGKISGDWQEIANWQKEEKNDNIDFKLSYNSDSTEMVIISSIEGTERNSYQIQLFDNNLKQNIAVR